MLQPMRPAALHCQFAEETWSPNGHGLFGTWRFSWHALTLDQAPEQAKRVNLIVSGIARHTFDGTTDL
jgi:hypothetical protein